MVFSKEKNNVFEYFLITSGVFILAAAIIFFIEPASLVIGGVSGLGIIIRSEVSRFGINVPLWLTNIILNIPLFTIALKIKGFSFIRRTLFATAVFSPALYIASLIQSLDLEFINALKEIDVLLAAVFGGALMGLGLGTVFRFSATTGGSDLAAVIIQKYKAHIPISKILFYLDFAVISLGFFTFGAQKAMYAVIAVFISSRVIDAIMSGLAYAKAAFIISDNYTEIANRIMATLKRGVTSLQGTGMFTGAGKNVILCVVSVKETAKLKEIVYNTDNKAFVIVADVNEVLGDF